MVDYFENTANVKVKHELKLSGSVLYDLSERTIATESIQFIYDHLKYVKSRAKKLIAEQDIEVIETYYDKYQKSIPEIR